MVSEEENKILSQHYDKLIRLVDVLKGISPTDRTVTSLELVARNVDGTSQEITFDTNELDTYLLFTGLAELAQTRVAHLKNKMKENEDVRKNF
jgi:hypothetical protein